MADQDWNVGPNGRPKAEPTLGPSPRTQAAPEVEIPPDPEFEPIYQPRPKKRRGLRIFLVLLLTLGGGSAAAWYYYGDLLFIDPDQEIPLVQAEADPIKIRPESPGGMEIPDRDKLVYDRIPGAEERQAVERLLPPPETPLPRPVPEPALEGQPSAGPDAVTSPDAGTAPTAPSPTPPAPWPPVSDARPPPAPPTPLAAPSETAPPQTTPEVAAAPSPPRAPTAQQPETKPAPTTAAPTAPTAAPSAPPPPPAALSQEAQRKAAEVATRTPAPAARTSSGRIYQVQLAAVRARDRAEQEWARLRNGHKDLLGTLQLSVVRADLGAGKGVFYRLRVGPLKSEAVARDLCGKLAERKVPCLVVRPN